MHLDETTATLAASVTDKLVDTDSDSVLKALRGTRWLPSTNKTTTKRALSSNSKIRKVVKKLKRAKHWKAIDRLDGGDDSSQKWIPMWNSKLEKENNAAQTKRGGKKSKSIVCVHVAPTKQEQSQTEQFNLVRKCYSVKHIKRAEALDPSLSSYSPIIDPNRMMIRSPVMAEHSGNIEWFPVNIPKVDETELDDSLKEPTTEPAIDVIPPSNQTEPQTSSTTENINKSNYLNLYEYQTTNPLIETQQATIVEKVTAANLNDVSFESETLDGANGAIT